MNDQETNRISTATFATEQAIREIYARGFEIAVKDGGTYKRVGTNGLMLAFNLIGISGSASYATSIQLFQKEWGYTGFTVTDAHDVSNDQTGWNSYQMVRGLTMPLGSLTKTGMGRWETQNGVTGVYVKGTKNGKTNDTLSYTQWYWVRELAHRILYNNVNTNGMLSGTGGNGYAATLLTNAVSKIDNYELTLGKSSTLDLDVAKLNTIFGSTGYTLTATGLPDGLTISNGKITGTPTSATGETKVTLNLVGNHGLGYITASTTFNLNVKTDALTLSSTSGTYDTAFNSTVKQTLVDLTASGVKYDPTAEANEANVGTYTSATLTADGLPYGLTLGAYDATKGTATITGTPKTVGTYKVTFTLTLGQIASRTMTMQEMMASMMGGGGMGGGDDVNGDGGKSGSTKYDQNTDDPDLSTDTSTGNNQAGPGGGGDMMGMGPGGMNMTTYSVAYTSYTVVQDITIGAGSATLKTISFDSNDGTVVKLNTASTSTVSLSNEEKAYVKPASSNGKVFLGWSTTKNSTEVDADLSAIDVSKGDVTYYAVWYTPSNSNVSVVAVQTTELDDGTEVEIILSDGTSTSFTVKNGEQGLKGETGDVGDPGTPGEAGESGSGVAGLVIGIIALVVALGAAAVIVVILLKKKN
jgi:uncharacterized repeat protein (TIGR02543 family)